MIDALKVKNPGSCTQGRKKSPVFKVTGPDMFRRKA
jgi:hypothetical protein